MQHLIKFSQYSHVRKWLRKLMWIIQVSKCKARIQTPDMLDSRMPNLYGYSVFYNCHDSLIFSILAIFRPSHISLHRTGFTIC